MKRRVMVISKKVKNNKFFLLTVFILSLLAPILFNSQTGYQIVISDSGFSRREIVIPKGATIVWKVSGDKTHWPASDVHPLHNSYPEEGGCLGSKLDACKPLKRGENFRFKFETPGTWGIHDHLYSQFTMTVVVEEGRSNTFFEKFFEKLGLDRKDQETNDMRVKNRLQKFSAKQRTILKELDPSLTSSEASEKAHIICSDLKGAKFREKQHCYSEVFYFVTGKKDQKFAFQILTELQKIDPSTRVCHLIAHGIGWAMYERDPDNLQDAIGKMSPECSYGGIHGIVERFNAITGRPLGESDLKNVCAKNPNWACYHAIGHVLLVQEKNDLSKSTKLCSVYKDNMPKFSCLNGVFMEHMIGQNLAEHGFVTLERRKNFSNHLGDFEELCLKQKGDNTRACWTEIIHASVAKYKGDIDKIYTLCDKAQTKEAAMGCRRHALAEIVPLKNFEPMDVKYICLISMKNDPEFERDCYMMLASTVMSNAPDKVNSAIDFCSSLEQGYRQQCFGSISAEIALLKLKAPEKASSVCQKVETEYKSICENREVEPQGFSEQ